MLVLFDEEGGEKLPRKAARGAGNGWQKCRLLRIVKKVESLIDPLVGVAVDNLASNRSDSTFGKFWRNCSRIG